MGFFDEYLRKERMRQAEKYIKKGDIVLDLGCHSGIFLKKHKNFIKKGYGFDELCENKREGNIYFKKFKFKKKIPYNSCFFNSIVMLAVLEHIPNKNSLVKECYRVLKKGGRIIITVPSPKSDKLIAFLVKIKIIKEIDFFEQHDTPTHEEVINLFKNNEFKLLKHKKFQLGYNNVYIFEK